MDGLRGMKVKNEDKKKLAIVKIFKFILNIVFVFIIILLVTMIFSIINSKLKKEAPNLFGYKFYVVLSQSMKPTLDIGSLVGVKPINPVDLRVGDIITFTSLSESDITTTHRIVEIDNEKNINFITKGDANAVNDQYLVSADNVVGKVVFYIPYIGKLLNYVKTKIGIIILIVVPSMIIGISESIKLVTYLRKRVNSEDVNDQADKAEK